MAKFIVYERGTDVKLFQGNADEVAGFIRETESNQALYAYNNRYTEFDVVKIPHR